VYFIFTSSSTDPSTLAGQTTLGHGPTDVDVQGPGVAAQHCYIVNQSGIITLHPCGNPCAVDGLPVTQPVRLCQGKIRTLLMPKKILVPVCIAIQ